MKKKIRWGILSTANIGQQKVIPAMQQSEYCDVMAIASRNAEQAKAVSEKLGIAKSYGSYEALLADPNIDAIYIPLPNNMHVPWAIKGLEAGKHVLCEKPIGLTSAEAKQLMDASKKYPHLKVMEAFMYRFHPQWQFAKKLVDEDKIGELKTIQCFFSYFNVNADNIRNRPEVGGGALMDIGCYCISQSRYIFGTEPTLAMGMIDFDQEMKTDRLTSAMLQFPNGTSTFTCSTQADPYQRVNIVGTKGRIEIEIPVNSPPDMPSRIWVHSLGVPEEIIFNACNQYIVQVDEFSKAILNDTHVPTSLQDAINNMKVIEAVLKSHKIGGCLKIS